MVVGIACRPVGSIHTERKFCAANASWLICLCPMADPGCKGRKKPTRLKQSIISCLAGLCRATNQKSITTLLFGCGGFLRKTTAPVVDRNGDSFILQAWAKLLSESDFPAAVLLASSESVASSNKVRGETIYYFGGDPSWRNLDWVTWWSNDSNRFFPHCSNDFKILLQLGRFDWRVFEKKTKTKKDFTI